MECVEASSSTLLGYIERAWRHALQNVTSTRHFTLTRHIDLLQLLPVDGDQDFCNALVTNDVGESVNVRSDCEL